MPIEKDSLAETLLEIAAKHGNAVSVGIVASYASQRTDEGRDALIQAIGECYSPMRFADESTSPTEPIALVELQRLQFCSDSWFAIEPGEAVYAWYRHPGDVERLVILTGTAWTPKNPHVEWVDKYAVPKELRRDDRLIKASDLPGEWAECVPPAQFARGHWSNTDSPPAPSTSSPPP